LNVFSFCNTNFVSILGHILQQESIEVIETTKKQSGDKHSMTASSLEQLPEEFLSLYDMEKPMMVSLEKNDSNKMELNN